MDKYTKALILVLKIPVGIICILTGIGLLGVSVWVSTFSVVANMVLLMSLLGGGFLINYGVGYAFLGDEYKATNIVRKGDTLFAPVESTKFLKRRKIVTFIGFISYVLLAVYYFIKIILISTDMQYRQEYDLTTGIIALVIFAIISLVIAFCLFMVYKKTKHIDLNENEVENK